MSVNLRKSNSPLAGLYLLFAELLHRELDQQLLDLLMPQDVLDVFLKVEPACADYLNKEWTDADLEQAAVEFCDLFIIANEPAGFRVNLPYPVRSRTLPNHLPQPPVVYA